MTIRVLPDNFCVCKVRSMEQIDFSADFLFVGKTDQEISLVCPAGAVPESALAREDGWKAFRIEGTLDFALVGVLAELSGLLAREGISIFAVSTYDTDYILVKNVKLAPALHALRAAGHVVEIAAG